MRERLGFWYGLAVALVKPLLLVFTRRDWRGLEHVPADGPVIVVANHLSHLDPLTIADALIFGRGRPPRYLAKAELFRVPLLSTLMRGARQIPVHRHTSDAALALTDAVAAIEAGRCVLIYPEGTITRDPEYWPMTARTGVARLALSTGAPVVPLTHWGEQAILPPYARRPRLRPRRRVAMLAGPPVDLTPWQGRPLTAAVLYEATDAVMATVRDQLVQLRGEPAPDAVWDMRVGERVAGATRRPA